MKYTIFGFNQEILIKKYPKFDLSMALILQTLIDFCACRNQGIKRVLIDNEEYTWINYQHLINELPILQISDKGAISKRINLLKKWGLIKTFRAPEGSIYIRLTQKVDELMYNREAVDVNQRGVAQSQQPPVAQSQQHKPSINNNPSSNNTSEPKARRETDIQKVVNYFFQLKGWDKLPLEDLKKQKIIYGRFTRPAKNLLVLTNNDISLARQKLLTIKNWADASGIDWGIETVFKRWFDLPKLPQEKKKRPKINGCPAYQRNNRWYVICEDGEHREFAGDEKEIKYE